MWITLDLATSVLNGETTPQVRCAILDRRLEEIVGARFPRFRVTANLD